MHAYSLGEAFTPVALWSIHWSAVEAIGVVVQAASVILLVGITGFYARQTTSMANETKNLAAATAIFPKVTVKRGPGSGPTATDRYAAVEVTNHSHYLTLALKAIRGALVDPAARQPTEPIGKNLENMEVIPHATVTVGISWKVDRDIGNLRVEVLAEGVTREIAEN